MDEGRIDAEPHPGVMVFIDLTGQTSPTSTSAMSASSSR
jgi:hypothetical protein